MAHNFKVPTIAGFSASSKYSPYEFTAMGVLPEPTQYIR
jgi:hypothetical protein